PRRCACARCAWPRKRKMPRRPRRQSSRRRRQSLARGLAHRSARLRPPRHKLTLLLRAKKGRAPGLADTAHPLGAGTTRAGLALMAVDRPAVLEIAEF